MLVYQYPDIQQSSLYPNWICERPIDPCARGWKKESIPFRLVLCEDFALGVVADDFDVDEAAQIELFRAKHRHLCVWRKLELLVVGDDVRGLKSDELRSFGTEPGPAAPPERTKIRVRFQSASTTKYIHHIRVISPSFSYATRFIVLLSHRNTY